MPSDPAGGARPSFILLNDQPVVDPTGDLLGMEKTAKGIADMLISSRAASPFVLAIDAQWGMGKSTLLRQIESRLSARGGDTKVAAVWFNAWTAEGSDALEGLIKSVLEELDSSLVRRWTRKVAKRRRLLGIAWIGFALLGRFFGIARLVDELWKQVTIDAKSRNQLRDDIQGMLKDWVDQGGRRNPDRYMVVFIDDLDRCSDDVVVKVCEAIKLYLDAPGLIFVLACDQSVLARSVSASARGEAEAGRSYLEKIIQVVYRVPPPNESELAALIHGYARMSCTEDLIDPAVERILVEGTGRNPRKIKRIINSFILEYQLDPAWREPPLTSEHLVIAILLQHLYTPFYDLLISEGIGPNPIGEFLYYAQLRRDLVLDSPVTEQEDAARLLEQALDGYHLARPHVKETAEAALKRLEQRLPEEFPGLAASDALVALLNGVGNDECRDALRTRLANRPLVTSTIQLEPESVSASQAALAGLRIVCVDDNPESLHLLLSWLKDLGAVVTVYADAQVAEREILRRSPDVVISDITRGEDPDGGFTAARRLRAEGYGGPLIFFTARITPERRQLAHELGASDVVNTEAGVINTLTDLDGTWKRSDPERVHAPGSRADSPR
jgi:CheY-like chemotaxis protein